MADKFDIYPLTITKDRYRGTYSGGEWTAWNCNADAVPSDISQDDVTCCDFWSRARDTKVKTKTWGFTYYMEGDDEFICPVFGVGDSIEMAVENLNKRLSEVELC